MRSIFSHSFWNPRSWRGKMLLTGIVLALGACAAFPFAGDNSSQRLPKEGKLASDALQRFCLSGNGRVQGMPDLTANERGQLHSLCTVWYPGSAVPLLPVSTVPELTDFGKACERLWDAPETERDFLQLAFHMKTSRDGQAALCYFSMLDNDSDGVLDFQVTDSGRFIENDIDVDGDGVPNVRDTNPLDPAIGEPLACGNAPLPEHLDGACLSGTATACELQNKLFKEFDIVVIDRNSGTAAEVLENNLQTVYDAANLVFRDGFANHPGSRAAGCPGLWTMQTVAFEPCAVARKTPWDPGNLDCLKEGELTTEASAMAHSGLFSIFPAGSILPPVIQLGTYVHELAHLWQFAYDIRSESDTRELLKDNLWLVPGFEAELEQWDWEFPKVSDDEVQAMKDRYTNLLPREDDVTVLRDDEVTLLGYTLQQHLAAVTYEGLVTSDENKKLGNFGSYSLSNPWEWHADMFIAYLYRALEQHIQDNTSVEVAGEFIAWFRAHVLDQYNNQFYHPNLKDDIFKSMQAELLPIKPVALDELLCRYLVNDAYTYSPLRNASTFAYFAKEPPEHLQREIVEEWGQICDALSNQQR